MTICLNDNAARLCAEVIVRADQLRIDVHRVDEGGVLIDCGVRARGGLEAGLALAEICLAGLGRVQLVADDPSVWTGPAVTVRTDHAVAACMASQYAGWQIAAEDYFAMGSGPMRAAAGREALYDAIGFRERPAVAVGVLESNRLPTASVCAHLAEACGVSPAGLTLLVARTASLAGSLQVVARTVETALHKLHELDFDLGRVQSGVGVAPLPPIAADDLTAIGRTNDAVLYGGRVTLWVRGDDASLAAVAPRVPSSASPDFGRPFAEIFAHYDRDFYRIDPQLFSPAVVTLINLDTGRSWTCGEPRPELLRASFLA